MIGRAPHSPFKRITVVTMCSKLVHLCTAKPFSHKVNILPEFNNDEFCQTEVASEFFYDGN